MSESENVHYKFEPISRDGLLFFTFNGKHIALRYVDGKMHLSDLSSTIYRKAMGWEDIEPENMKEYLKFLFKEVFKDYDV